MLRFDYLSEYLGKIPVRTILALAFVARVLFWLLTPAYIVRFPDSAVYTAAANDILRLDLITSSNVMPGYPLLIAMLGAVRPLQIMVDILLGTATVWLLFRLVEEISPDRLAPRIAAIFWALYPLALFFSIAALTETVFMFLVLAGLYCYLTRRFLLGHVALVAGILTRPHLEIIAPLLLIAFCTLTHRMSLAETARKLAVYAVVYLMMMAPWWAHNYLKYGTFVRLNVGGGIVLYVGNNPMNKSGGGINLVDGDLSSFQHIENVIERDNAMKQAAFAYIRDNPGRFIELAGLKALRFWRPWPYAPLYYKPLYITVVAIGFIPLAVFGVVGFFWGLRHTARRYLPLALYVVYLMSVHMVTISSIRYRVPIEPILAIFGAPLVAHLLRRRDDAAQMPS